MNPELPSGSSSLFEVATPLGFTVRTTLDYWNFIVTVKHPVMRNRLTDVQLVLANPDEVRLSKSDTQVYLFYREENAVGRWVCAVARRLNGNGFLITTYRTSAIKEGEQIWQK